MKAKAKKPRIYGVSFASVYPLYIKKAEAKGRTKAEVDEIIRWLTGHSQKSLDKELEKRTSFRDFFVTAAKGQAPVVVAAAGGDAEVVATPGEAAARAIARTRPGDWMLLKASRGMRLERVLDAIRQVT